MFVCLILFPGCQYLDHSNVRAVFSVLWDLPGQNACTIETRSLDGGPVTTTEGPVLTPDRQGWEIGQPPDLVLMLTGQDPLAYLPLGLRGFLIKAAKGGATLGEVGNEAAVLAHLGWLGESHRRSTALPRSAKAESLTTKSGTALVQALHAWLARATLPAIAQVPDAADQPDPVLRRMVMYMNAGMRGPLSIGDICAGLGQSPKQLRLRCQRRMGRTPAQVYHDLRLARARQLLQGGALAVTDVAQAVGFASHSAFSRSYRQHFGCQPRQFRRIEGQGPPVYS